MTLTRNDFGFHTFALLAADLKKAIDAGYRALQVTLMDLRDIGYHQSPVNLKKDALFELGRYLLKELEEDAEQVAELRAHKAALLREADEKAEEERLVAIAPEDMSPITRDWVANRGRDAIVMVYDPHTNGGRFVTYSTHARRMARALNLMPDREFGFTVINIPCRHLWHYRSRLLAQGIQITLIGEGAECAAA